jgi:hypothetical protein
MNAYIEVVRATAVILEPFIGCYAAHANACQQ